MPEHSAPRFFSGARRDLTRNDVADPAKAIFAVLIRVHDDLAVPGARSLGDNYNGRKTAAVGPGIDGGRNLVVIEWNLGDQNNMRAAGDTAVQGNPAGVAPHDFQQDRKSV